MFGFKCIAYWPEDGRPYVALGKILSKQSKLAEARIVYEKGCQSTQGENAYIWQVLHGFLFDFDMSSEGICLIHLKATFCFSCISCTCLLWNSVGLSWKTGWEM